MKQTFTTKLLSFIDEKLLIYATAFLTAFIPLYPKIPLIDLVPGYIVRLRLEDVLIGVVALFWVVQFMRKKVSIHPKMTHLILLYIAIGFASVLSALFITQTVPLHEVHVQKTVLHLLRNIEYFALFFITYSAVRSKKDALLFLKVCIATFVVVALYGLGQKYLYWPVYSTMNREFSKGIRLYLTEHARVQSTFGGHYDLAAYSVILLPIILTTLFTTTKKYLKWLLWGVFALGVWMLVVSAARTSFGATIISLGIVLLLSAAKQQKEKLRFFVQQSAIVSVLFGYMLFQFGDDIYSRFLNVLESYPELNTTYHETNAKRKYFFYEYIPEKIGLREELKEITIKPPENGIATDDATTQKIDAVLIPTDQQPVTQRPNDVYIDVPNIVEVATISATGQTEITLVEQPRTYSDNALRYGLSMAIRLDTLWPQAWRGFTTNPLLGSGYATLTKASVTEFTEADSTDNNFLRVLGEVGLLGFVAFFGIICSTLLQAKNIYLSQKNASFETLFAAAYISGTIGLLLNAVLIDVFVSSKVAFTFWTVTGVLLAISSFTTSTPNTKKSIATKKSA